MSFFSLNKSKFSKENNTLYLRGFTLVELIVSLGIMMIIISTVAYNQTRYSSGAALKILANEIGLSLRQAQVYGISVKEFTAGSNDFSPGYGMTFSTVGGNNNQYIFFADRGIKNSYYDGTWTCTMGGSTDECLGKTALTNKNLVSDLCVITSVSVETCGLGRIDISFIRPKTDAHFVFFDTSLNIVNYVNAKGAKIKLISSTGEIRSVTTYSTGQISVQ